MTANNLPPIRLHAQREVDLILKDVDPGSKIYVPDVRRAMVEAFVRGATYMQGQARTTETNFGGVDGQVETQGLAGARHHAR